MIKAPRGTKDILPDSSYAWQFIESKIRGVCRDMGYREIRTPSFEHTELFLRGVGDTTDIVQKEMYTFNDKGDRSITLRPEGTAGVVRALIENGLYNQALPLKMYYLALSVFRYENPQAGRLRQHHQFGIEVFGAESPTVDAEVIAVAMTLFKRLGLKELSLHINSIGCPKCRPNYQQALREFLSARLDRLCPMCKQRFETNPLRILDCKEESCKELLKGVPTVLDHLCEECEEHFTGLKTNLELLGFDYDIDPFIVRGLDYYTKTVFEIVSTAIGSQGTVCGGGRYDGLCEQLGGPALPGIGFGMGMERLLMVLDNEKLLPELPPTVDVFVGALGEKARAKAYEITNQLRDDNVATEFDHMGRSAKAQFKYMDKLGARFGVLIGDSELETGRVRVKDLRGGEGFECGIDELTAMIILNLKQG